MSQPEYQTERSRLDSRFAALKSRHATVDLKFFLGRVSEATTESVCRDVNRMLDDYLERDSSYELDIER